jgi:hypothetical protein
LYKQAAFQITKILTCFKFCLKHKINIHRKEIENFNLKGITSKAIEFLYVANDDLNMLEILKRKIDFDKEVSLQYIQVDSEINRITVLLKELELRLCSFSDKSGKLNELYANYIVSPYCINYSVSARVNQLSLKARLNWETYRIMRERKDDNIYYENLSIFAANDYKWNKSIHKIFSDSNGNEIIKLETGKKCFRCLNC